jgi:hypothetical protein
VIKVRYLGLEKNAQWLFATCALANLYGAAAIAAATTGVVCLDRPNGQDR